MINEYYHKGLDILRRWWNQNRQFFRDERERRAIYTYKDPDIDKLHDRVLREASPCFVLSTGRAGTALFTKILSQHKGVHVEHNPVPELTFHSAYAYSHWQQKPEICKAMIDVARYEYVRNAFIRKQTFVESNPRITFFAHSLAELFPKAKFIQLIRHPADFIASGMARNWYIEGRIRDEGKIKPENPDEWKKWSQEEKIAWLWQETNAFIEAFKKQCEKDRVLTIRAEDFFSDEKVSAEMARFIGLEPLPDSDLAKLIRKPVNAQRSKSRVELSASTLEKMPLISKYYPT